MEIPEQLHCLYSASIENRNGSYVVDVPARELERGELRHGETYRVAIVASPSSSSAESETTDAQEPPEPPVEEGEIRDVEIEDIGEQGDGITRVERGFVVIVPETDESERVTIEITDVRRNVAFADVIERAGGG